MESSVSSHLAFPYLLALGGVPFIVPGMLLGMPALTMAGSGMTFGVATLLLAFGRAYRMSFVGAALLAFAISAASLVAGMSA